MGKGCRWGGQFRSNLRPRWTRSCHSKEGFQVSRGHQKREQGESARGAKGARGSAIYIANCICVYNNCLNVVNPLYPRQLFFRICVLLSQCRALRYQV
jgi:hypothetical protein